MTSGGSTGGLQSDSSGEHTFTLTLLCLGTGTLRTGDLAEFWEGPWPSLHGQDGGISPPWANLISQNREVTSQGAPENPFPLVKGTPALGRFAWSPV